MKKITSIVASLLALLLLCACNQERSEPNQQFLDSTLAQSVITEEPVEETKTSNEDIFVPQTIASQEEELQQDIVETQEKDEELQQDIATEPEEIVEEEPLSIPTDSIEIALNEYGLELPINGATGYTSIKMPLYDTSTRENVIATLEAGTAFRIISEEADMWFVDVNGTLGWLKHCYCLINLPDVIPSMVYDNTNSYNSMYKSVGYPLEGITGEELYDATSYSSRFSKTQYLMPVLYAMSKKICSAQNEALKNGHCLKLYEGFRPAETQTRICKTLGDLMNTNAEVNKHISTYPWGKGWFISTGISNHQRGCAIDVSLVDILSAEYKYCGDYAYLEVTEYEEFEMPTAMHELSNLAVTFTSPVNSKSKTAWENATLSSSMTEGAINLQKYCTESSLTPLSSEWWHFNDLDAREAVGKKSSDGKFFITESYSQIPE